MSDITENIKTVIREFKQKEPKNVFRPYLNALRDLIDSKLPYNDRQKTVQDLIQNICFVDIAVNFPQVLKQEPLPSEQSEP